MRVLDLFSGIGGFSLGLERAGFKTVAFCEIEPFCRQVLKKHWPEVPIYEDVRELTAEKLKSDGITGIDVVCGGFPCQPFSSAGKRGGKEDHRYLWPEMLRVIKECQPAWVIGENVARIDGMALSDIQTDLEAIGYEVAPPLEIPACAVGQDHFRPRIWICGYSNKNSKPSCAINAEASWLQTIQANTERWEQPLGRNVAGAWRFGEQIPRNADGESKDHALGMGANDGLPNRLDRLRGLGNAVVPQIPELIGRAIMKVAA